MCQLSIMCLAEGCELTFYLSCVEGRGWSPQKELGEPDPPVGRGAE